MSHRQLRILENLEFDPPNKYKSSEAFNILTFFYIYCLLFFEIYITSINTVFAHLTPFATTKIHALNNMDKSNPVYSFDI